MGKKFHALVVVGLIGALPVVAPGTPSVSAEGLTYPGVFESFKDCASDTDEFCIERLEFTPTNGATTRIVPAVVDAMDRFSGDNPNVSVFFHAAYNGPSSLTGPMSSASLNVNVYKGTDSMHVYPPNGKTINGLTDGAYRFVIRTGDFDPSFMLLTGRFVSYTVSKNANGYFKIDMTARPTPLAMVMGESQTSRIAIDKCEQNHWVTDCEANRATRGEILASFMMNSMSQIREATRGMWMAGNASTLQMGPFDPASATIDVTAKGPHFVPSDFGIEGLVKEGDRYLNPAHFEMGLPFEMIAKMLSLKMGMTVTVEMVKTYLAKPGELLSGTIEEVPAGASAAVEKAQALTLAVGEDSLRVNFNLTHFSAPNPTLKISPPASATTATNSGAQTTAVTKKLANGATLAVPKSAKRGKTTTAKALLSPSKGASITKVVSKSASVCKVTGSKVRMVKSGSCKLVVTVRAGSKKTASASVTIRVT